MVGRSKTAGGERLVRQTVARCGVVIVDLLDLPDGHRGRLLKVLYSNSRMGTHLTRLLLKVAPWT